MYEKQTWKNGDVITEDKLNHIEDGIANAGGSGGGMFPIEAQYSSETSTYTLNKTFKEILDAANEGKFLFAYRINEIQSVYYFIFASISANSYTCVLYDDELHACNFGADSENDYPTYSEGSSPK